VVPRPSTNAAVRPREYLTGDRIERLITFAKMDTCHYSEEKVGISGFGTFEAVRRETREGRNPQTGAKMQLAASTVVKFRPGKPLRDAVNAGG
jgi:nucleoid DNA-binding protein